MALKVLKGGKAPGSPATASPAAECPVYLGAPGRAAWAILGRLLADRGGLTEDLAPLAELYCDAADQLEAAREAIRDHGLVIDSALGGVKSNPAVSAAKQSRDLMAKILAELGLTPASRARLALGGPAEPRDDLAAFLNRRKGG